MNIVKTIRYEASAFNDHVAIIDGDNTLTYRQLLEHVSQLSQLLALKGIGGGQRVALHCGDGIDYVIGSLALLECGAAVVPVADNLTDNEVVELAHRIDVHGILLHNKVSPSSCEATPEKIDTSFGWQPRLAKGDSDQHCQNVNAAFIRFSSGTTGESKGVVLSHQSIIDRTDAANRGLVIVSTDVILWVLAMSYHFVVSILLFLRKGATIIVANQFFPFSVINAATQHRITFIYGSPIHYHLLAASAAVPQSALAKVRLAISTSMKMSLDICEQFVQKFGFSPAEAYGIIEVGLPFINTDPEPLLANTVGRILPDYQLRIDAPDENGIGEVMIKGKGMFDAYFSPWRSRDDVTMKGWFNTGDIGRVDSGGRLFLIGRSKTVLVCAGMKVFPEEVELVINMMRGVKECRVLGRNHPQFGQVPVAQIVVDDSVGSSASVIDELRSFCCQKLSAYKVPIEFEEVISLPKTPSGKIARVADLTPRKMN